MWMNCVIRRYNLAWEIIEYCRLHPKAAVVELGAGHCPDRADVIALREKHIPKGKHERTIVCDLNDFSWFKKINFIQTDGIVFTTDGLFYYFEKEQVRRLFCTMTHRFPGGMITSDAVNALILKNVYAEVKLAGEQAGSFFSLKRLKEDLEGWSKHIVNVSEKTYADGYLKDGCRKTPVTRLFNWAMQEFHMSFMLHVEFWTASEVRQAQAAKDLKRKLNKRRSVELDELIKKLYEPYATEKISEKRFKL